MSFLDICSLTLFKTRISGDVFEIDTTNTQLMQMKQFEYVHLLKSTKLQVERISPLLPLLHRMPVPASFVVKFSYTSQ